MAKDTPTVPLLGQRSLSLEIDGTAVPVAIRRNRRARRFILRMDPKGTGVVVTMPAAAAERDALAFAMRQAGWIRERLGRDGGAVAFAHGALVPYRGTPHLIVHEPGRRGSVRHEEDALDGPRLNVAGDGRHLPRRLTDWLKAQARRDLSEASQRYGEAMGLRYRRLTVRDQTSRWGSCSSTGALSYSWRLILAPPDILDYVAAHEVAHLAEMNHGPRFWALVYRHCPHADRARAWLREHGTGLHRYGG